MEQEQRATAIPVVLLTGEPRMGKSTLIKQVIDRLGRERCGGFSTEEVVENGRRTGFRLVTLDGPADLLAHERSEGQVRHGRYGVNLACLERLGVPAIARALAQQRLVVIDELGPMEAHAEAFRQIVLTALESQVPVIGTIANQPHPWLDRVRVHPRVRLWMLTRENREGVLRALVETISGSGVTRPGSEEASEGDPRRL